MLHSKVAFHHSLRLADVQRAFGLSHPRYVRITRNTTANSAMTAQLMLLKYLRAACHKHKPACVSEALAFDESKIRLTFPVLPEDMASVVCRGAEANSYHICLAKRTLFLAWRGCKTIELHLLVPPVPLQSTSASCLQDGNFNHPLIKETVDEIDGILATAKKPGLASQHALT